MFSLMRVTVKLVLYYVDQFFFFLLFNFLYEFVWYSLKNTFDIDQNEIEITFSFSASTSADAYKIKES